jgi:hypothetical protein
MKRKWIAAIMVVSMLAGMCGCAGAGPEAPEGGDSEDSQTGSLADSQPLIGLLEISSPQSMASRPELPSLLRIPEL